MILRPRIVICALLAAQAMAWGQFEELLRDAEKEAASGDHSAAAEKFAGASALAPESESIRFRLASQLVFAGRFREAEEIFHSLEKSPDPAMAAMASSSLAAISTEQTRREEYRAKEAAQRARDVRARAEASRRAAEYNIKKEDLAKRQVIYDKFAAADYREALSLLDAYAKTHAIPPDLIYAEVFALLETGETAEARRVLDGMPETERNSPRWLVASGRVERARGRTSAAWKDFSGAARAAGDSSLGQEARAELLSLPLEADPDRNAWGDLRLEAQYLTRFSDAIFYGELREGLYVPGARWLQPFVQLDFTLDTLSGEADGISQVYANNLAGAHAGLRIKPFENEAFWIYGMVGPQKDLRGTTRFDGRWFLDWRLGVRGFKGFGPGLSFLPPENGAGESRFTPRLAWFVEAGADAAYYSLYQNFIAYGQARQGFRVADFGTWLGIDLYALEQGSADTGGLYYNNFLELGGGARAITRLAKRVSLVTRIEYLGGFYAGVANDDSRGDLPETYTDLRVTVSLWAEW